MFHEKLTGTMGKNKVTIPIRQLVDGYYINKRYSTTSYLVLLIACILTGLVTLGSDFGYFEDSSSMEGFGHVNSTQVFLSIPFQDVKEWLVYLIPGITYSFFLLLVLPKSRILHSNYLTLMLLVLMYGVAFLMGHLFAIPNVFTGGIFAVCIGLMMEVDFKKKWNISLGVAGAVTGLLGTFIALSILPNAFPSRIPYFYCYMPWQILIGIFLIYNYEEESHEIIQIP